MDFGQRCIAILNALDDIPSSEIQVELDDGVAPTGALLDAVEEWLDTGSSVITTFVGLVKTAAGMRYDRASLDTSRYRKQLQMLLASGAREFGGKEQAGYRFFVALLAWDQLMADLKYMIRLPRVGIIWTNASSV
jgi:hypothetical protein